MLRPLPLPEHIVQREWRPGDDETLRKDWTIALDGRMSRIGTGQNVFQVYDESGEVCFGIGIGYRYLGEGKFEAFEVNHAALPA